MTATISRRTMPRTCTDCDRQFVRITDGPKEHCPDCAYQRRLKASREWKQRNPKPKAPLFRPCKAEGCDNPVPRSGKVYAHYCSDDCKPRCSVEGCDNPSRKMTWCISHHSQWRRTGEVKPFKYKWSNRETCLNTGCHEPTGAIPGLRKYCSWSCRAYWDTYGENPPTLTQCVQCNKDLPLGKIEGRRRRQRLDIKICRRCRQDLRKYGMSVDQIAARDGVDCKLCNEPVEMTLRAPHPGCPSVDHRVPRSKGGTNDPENLQLAHLKCNILKHDKLLPT